MYVSRVVTGSDVVSWVGDVTSKLSGFCGCVHGACERWSVFLFVVLSSNVWVTMSMTCCGVFCVVLVSWCLSVNSGLVSRTWE